MKAFLGKIAPKVLQPKETVQNTPSKQTSINDVDRLYAILRRQGERLTQLESRTSDNRRDIFRIEKRIQRGAEIISPEAPQREQELCPPGCEGVPKSMWHLFT